MTERRLFVETVLCSTSASAQPTSRWYAGGSASTLRVGADEVETDDGLPRRLSTADNEAGWRSALSKLAALVEAG